MYFRPAQIARDLKSLGIQKWFVSSTSTCNQEIDFAQIVDEFAEIRSVAREQTLAILWLTPEMVARSPDLAAYDELDFKMVKIHPYIHPWPVDGKEIAQVFSMAGARSIPLMIHTGGKLESEAGQFLGVCQRHPEVTVVLAHCRPVEQALRVLQSSPNVYGDISFASNESIQILSTGGVISRLLFGSDYPMDSLFFPNEDRVESYRRNLKRLERNFGASVLTRWGKCTPLLAGR